ncbi:MAG: cysteine desulfurase-like protein [Acidobacteria bacterium]|nr:cysteine desulfurase-like protein [Acidobacteriota bacterium]
MLDLGAVRAQFPALRRRDAGREAVFFDGPAGSQVPRTVIDAVSRYLATTNANHGGAFATSRESDAMLAEARRAAADFVGAPDPDGCCFGANMTTLTFALSRALARTWTAGDNIVVTRLDHDANVTPWTRAAEEAGVEVRHAAIRPDCTLDVGDLASKLSSRTRLVAVGAASNAVGTVNPIGTIAELAHAAGALVFCDAVHYAPHRRIDVAAWGCDLLVCSAYKFFGPHVGLMWGRRDLLETLPTYKVRPAPELMPGRWMTGTPNAEGIAGTLAAIDYIASLGRGEDDARTRPEALDAAFAAIVAHERALGERLQHGLDALPQIRSWGITDVARFDERVPTFAISHRTMRPGDVARTLAEAGVYVWSGNFYALPLTEVLGVEPDGLVRIGLLHYNTADEVDHLLRVLRDLP